MLGWYLNSQYIYGQGGRNFWIHNTGPFGCLAYVLERIPISAAEVDKSGCGTPFNEVAQYFNRGLKKVVFQLRKKLPLAAITYVDVYSVKYKLISQARKHGEDKFNQRIRYLLCFSFLFYDCFWEINIFLKMWVKIKSQGLMSRWELVVGMVESTTTTGSLDAEQRELWVAGKY